MNVLILASRFPWPAYSGDRLRTTVWLDALAPHANVTLVAPGRRVVDSSRRLDDSSTKDFRFYPAKRSILAGARALASILRDGLPFQTLLAAPYAWDEAIALARRERGPFDATIVILSRIEPWVRDALPPGARILDAIDSLARNMHERARAASPLMRWIWRTEERRTAAAEREATRIYDHVLFVSDEEAAACGPRGVAVSNGVPVQPLQESTRRFAFGFWGRLAYFANADAARWLIDEIWPVIHALRPEATLAIAGANAPSWLRRAAGRAPGVTLLSPVDDMPSFARMVRVAILPLRYGSGESTKMLEAAEAGCAVVTTTRGVRSLAELAPHAMIAEDAQAIAHASVALLDDPARGAALRRVVVERYSRAVTLDRLVALVRKRAA
jgi:glycosyltransferase involved in cell wall biosynthesis